MLPSAALADIVFFDTNNAPMEIEAAKRAARRRGEQVHVYPFRDPAMAVRITNIQSQMRRLEDEHRRPGVSEQRRSEIVREYENLDRERRPLMRQNMLNARSADEALKALRDRGVKVTSIVISGHSGNGGDFSGDNGSLHRRDLKNILKQMPDFAANIKSLFLPGCNTTRPACLDHDWLDSIPNLRAVGGYNGTAPSRERGAGHQFLERFLADEHRLAAARTPAAIRAVANSMIPGDVATTASICLPDRKYVTKTEYTDLAEAWKQCSAIQETIQRHNEAIRCYQEAREGCESPPNETQTGPLREYYVALQRLPPCYHNPEFQRVRGAIDGETLIRLMYWKNVTKNFAEENKTALEEAKQILLKAGVPPELADKMTKLKDISRRDLIKLIGDLNDFKATSLHNDRDMNDDEKTAALVAMESIIRTLSDNLHSLAPQCIPFHWVEANSTARSHCNASAGLGNSALELAKAELPMRRLDMKINRLSMEYNETMGRGRDRRDRDRFDDGYGQDQVVSDSAARQTLMRAQEQQYRARFDALHAERDLLATESWLRRAENDPRYAANAEDYRRHIIQLRQRFEQQSARARELGEPLDIRALRENPAAFFAAAARASELDTTAYDRDINAYGEQIARLRAQQETASEADKRWLQQDINHYERHLTQLRDRAAERQRHREYLQQMARVHTDNDLAARQRVAEIVVERIQLQRQRRMNDLSSRVAQYQAQVEQYTVHCSREGAPSWCQPELDGMRRRLTESTEQLRAMQIADDLTY